MAYIDSTINHLRALKEWAQRYQAKIDLDLASFEVEIRARNRYFTLYPRFLTKLENGRAYTTALGPASIGFVGWLPYRPIRLELSNDKLDFKQKMRTLNLDTPAMWSTSEQPAQDFILKQSMGSFGKDIAGPYRTGTLPDAQVIDGLQHGGNKGTGFYEQFVEGQNVKAWFWGDQLFHVEMAHYPKIVGNGQKTVADLVARCLEFVSWTIKNYPELPTLLQCLKFQGVSLDTVLGQGEAVWIDFRYARLFAIERDHVDTNAMLKIGKRTLSVLKNTGTLLAQELMKGFNAPVLYSVDGVLDYQGKLWWLELNSNPALPPTGYPFLLSTLFGALPEAKADVVSTSGLALGIHNPSLAIPTSAGTTLQ